MRAMKKCPVCGCTFIPAALHTYKVVKKSGYVFACSYHCVRDWERKQEERKKQRQFADIEEPKSEKAWSYCEKCGRKILVGEICFEIGDDDYCSDCCKRVNTRKEMLEQWMI